MPHDDSTKLLRFDVEQDVYVNTSRKIYPEITGKAAAANNNNNNNNTTTTKTTTTKTT